MEIFDLTGERHNLDGCLGCNLVSGNLESFGGVIYKDDMFMIEQDFELPIDGFIIISTIRHIEKFTELSSAERVKLVELINQAIAVLEKHGVANEYNVILEEKAGVHFHVWLMPRHDWMLEKFGKIIKNIQPIQEFSLKNMRNAENFSKIKQTCELLRSELSQN